MKRLEDSLHKYLLENCGESDYKNWFDKMHIKSYNGNIIEFTVPNQVIKDWIEDKLFHKLLSAVKSITDENPQIRIIPQKMHDIPDSINIYKDTSEYEVDNSNLVKRYTFDNFVVGNSNQFAHAAASSVAQSPGDQYNPLFIYGASGLGKTHLIQAIGHAIKERDPAMKIMYISTESFMNEFIKAISTRKTLEFKNKYRQLDVLLLDDIHFLKDKEKLQEEMFNTFNDLYNANNQIVLTADRLPREIPNLEERLVTRFHWGLVVDLKKPDFETRLAILRKKVENESLNISEEILNYIANNIKENVRLLEGVLLKLLAKATLSQRDIDINLAREIILDMSDVNYDHNVSHIAISPDEIINTVAKYFKITTKQIRSKKRTKSIVVPRQIAIYLIRTYTDLSLKDIAAKVNRKDHSTVIHALKKIESLKSDNQIIAGDISRINSLLNVD